MNVQQLKDAMPINPSDLDTELCLQSARATKAAEYALDAEIKLHSEQIAFDEFMGHKDVEIRENWKGAKAPTVAEMEAAMNRDKQVIAYRHKILRLEMNKKLLAILRDGWRSRKDLLVQKCINVRSEQEYLNSDFIKSKAA